uniref:Cytochrome c oxidase subunit NDUFA4 n=1 Tax=Catharus ustulatus TaxID=91951 RepID=A0A8C3TM49_CATUS
MVLGTILTHAKKHPALIPLFVIIGSGGVGAGLYLMRLAMFNPDVSSTGNRKKYLQQDNEEERKKICTQNFRIQKNICHYMTEEILHVVFLHSTKISFFYKNLKDKWKYYYHCKCF